MLKTPTREDHSYIKATMDELNAFAHSQQRDIANTVFCTLCYIPFHSMPSLHHHMRTQHFILQAACTKCDMKFSNQESLRKHVTQMKHSDGWFCFPCKKPLRTLGAFVTHMCQYKDFGDSWKDKVACFGEVGESWQCAVCYQVFWGCDVYEKHVAKCALDCKYCYYPCVSLYHLWSHMEDCRPKFNEFLRIRSGEFALLKNGVISELLSVFALCNYCSRHIMSEIQVFTHDCSRLSPGSNVGFSVVCLHCKGYFLQPHLFLKHIELCFPLVVKAFCESLAMAKKLKPKADETVEPRRSKITVIENGDDCGSSVASPSFNIMLKQLLTKDINLTSNAAPPSYLADEMANSLNSISKRMCQRKRSWQDWVNLKPSVGSSSVAKRTENDRMHSVFRKNGVQQSENTGSITKICETGCVPPRPNIVQQKRRVDDNKKADGELRMVIKAESHIDDETSCENCENFCCMIHRREICLSENSPSPVTQQSNVTVVDSNLTKTPTTHKKASEGKNDSSPSGILGVAESNDDVPSNVGETPETFSRPLKNKLNDPLLFSVFNHEQINGGEMKTENDANVAKTLNTVWGICCGCKINFVPLYDGFCRSCRDQRGRTDTLRTHSRQKAKGKLAIKVEPNDLEDDKDRVPSFIGQTDSLDPPSIGVRTRSSVSFRHCSAATGALSKPPSVGNTTSKVNVRAVISDDIHCGKCGHLFKVTELESHDCVSLLRMMRECSVALVRYDDFKIKDEAGTSGVINETSVCNVCKKGFRNRSTFEKHVCQSTLKTFLGSSSPPKKDKANTAFHEEDVDLKPVVDNDIVIEDSRFTNVSADKENDSSQNIPISNTAGTNRDKINVSNGEISNDQSAIDNQTAAKFQCPCGAVFPTERLLQWHLRTHNEDRPHVCQVCQSRFKRLSNLKEHWRFFHLKGRIPCMKCDQLFETSTKLREHSRVHTTHYKYTKRKVNRPEVPCRNEKLLLVDKDCAVSATVTRRR